MRPAAKPQPISLIERAAEVYDFKAALRTPLAEDPPAPPVVLEIPTLHSGSKVEAPVTIDRARLASAGFIVPGGLPGALAEEFRIIKRQLLLNASGAATGTPLPRGRMILVCSAQPSDGKTFCAVNLALSMAAEQDHEVLLVDADVAKPEIPATLGLELGRGLMDALQDPTIDAESLIVQTDISNLSLLAAGPRANNDTEMLASARTKVVLDGLAEANPSRIVIFDCAPALAASPAAVLALNVGQVVMVVRADRTTEAELRDALALVEGCSTVSLLLNSATFSGNTRSFGSYYGQSA